MQAPEKRLAGTAPMEQPAPRKPFAGKAALISGLIDAQKPEAAPADAGTPLSVRFPITPPDSRESAQILESKMVFETILDIVNARASIANYREEMLRQARSIAAKREASMENVRRPVAYIGPSGGPATKKDALVMALAEMGLDARIVAEKEIDGKALFTIECRGETNKVPIGPSAMESGDPVDAVKKILAFLSIGRTEEDIRAESLRSRRTSRPPPTPLGIDEKELDGRMVTFDGKLEHGAESKWIFTYTAKGMETSFGFSSDVTGEDLLDMIDEKIDIAHRTFALPYPASVLEWRSRGRAGKAYMAGVPEGLLSIACTLDFLSSCPARMRELVPEEYREGFDALKRLPPPYSAFLRAGDMQELMAALDSLDHPIHTIIRETYGEGKVKLNGQAQEEVASLLRLAPTVSAEVCDIAIGNIAEAHSLVSRDNWSALSGPAELKKNYFGMIYIVRKAIGDALADGSLEIEA